MVLKKTKEKAKTKTKVKGLRQRKKPDVKGIREKDRVEDKINLKPPKFVASKSLDVKASEEAPSDEPLLTNSFLKKWKKSLKGVGQV